MRLRDNEEAQKNEARSPSRKPEAESCVKRAESGINHYKFKFV